MALPFEYNLLLQFFLFETDVYDVYKLTLLC